MEDPNRFFNYDVIDANGDKIGKVNAIWVDEDTRRAEFLGVKTGWFGSSVHPIPANALRFDNERQALQAPFPSDQVKDAPKVDPDTDLSGDLETRVCDHYGISLPSRGTSLREGGPALAPSTAEGLSSEGEVVIPLAEENLKIGKRSVSEPAARIRKIVRTEHVSEPVELRREELHIEREPARGREVPADAFREREMLIETSHEEPVVEKEAHLTGEVRVGKDVQTEERRIEGEVRREDVEIDRESLQGRGRGRLKE